MKCDDTYNDTLAARRFLGLGWIYTLIPVGKGEVISRPSKMTALKLKTEGDCTRKCSIEIKIKDTHKWSVGLTFTISKTERS